MLPSSILFFPKKVSDRDLNIQHYFWKKIKLASASYKESYFCPFCKTFDLETVRDTEIIRPEVDFSSTFVPTVVRSEKKKMLNCLSFGYSVIILFLNEHLFRIFFNLKENENVIYFCSLPWYLEFDLEFFFSRYVISPDLPPHLGRIN